MRFRFGECMYLAEVEIVELEAGAQGKGVEHSLVFDRNREDVAQLRGA